MPSPNDTLITPGNGSITDTKGDVFTVTSGGTVDMNGSPLGYTANVIAGAFVNGHFWQENSRYLCRSTPATPRLLGPGWARAQVRATLSS